MLKMLGKTHFKTFKGIGSFSLHHDEDAIDLTIYLAQIDHTAVPTTLVHRLSLRNDLSSAVVIVYSKNLLYLLLLLDQYNHEYHLSRISTRLI